MADLTNKETAIDRESEKIGTQIHPVAKPEVNIGIDTSDEFYDNLVGAGESNAIDVGLFNDFSLISENRETLYKVFDTMAEDSTISAALEIYAEDATETNEQGRIMWAESSDASIAKYVEFLLNSLNVEKNMYSWMYSLIKYGDIYLKLYRQSDFNDDLFEEKDKTKLNEKFTSIETTKNTEENLNEAVIIKAYKKNDRLANYIEIVSNPGEMFELTKFGKTYAYVKTNSEVQNYNSSNMQLSPTYHKYKFNRRDVEVYNAVSFVHGALQGDLPRVPEQIQIFNNNDMDDSNTSAYTYTVKRGQSVLYNTYKIWRQVMLLENALLLNRLTKSSILRVIEVEVADMPKERVGPHLRRIKSMIEQKASLNEGNSMSEYTNPGAMENNIYVPTHGGVGAIQAQQIGGDVNVRDIADIDYFKNKYYASLKIPKQFLGDTDDAAGFNGGTSLSIISSRYAKTVKSLQNTMCQCITDAINILLLDRGLDNYVNRFTIHMQAPVTQEELDKRENTSSKIQISDDVMRMVDAIEDEVIKLKILKSLLSNAITNTEVIDLIQEQIESIEAAKQSENTDGSESDSFDFGDDFENSADDDFNSEFDFGDDFGSTMADDNATALESPASTESTDDSDSLPSPADLGGDFTDMI